MNTYSSFFYKKINKIFLEKLFRLLRSSSMRRSCRSACRAGRFGGESAGRFDIFARKLNWKERSGERVDGRTDGETDRTDGWPMFPREESRGRECDEKRQVSDNRIAQQSITIRLAENSVNNILVITRLFRVCTIYSAFAAGSGSFCATVSAADGREVFQKCGNLLWDMCIQ